MVIKDNKINKTISIWILEVKKGLKITLDSSEVDLEDFRILIWDSINKII